MIDTAPDRPLVAQGAAGGRVFQPGDAPYHEIRWLDPGASGTSSYDLLPGIPKRLDQYVTRITAPNPGVMTGPGTNTYVVGERELAVIDPGPAEPSHIRTILEMGAGRIRWVVCTHTHLDHASAAAAIQEATGASVAGRPTSDTGHDVQVVFDRILSEGDRVECDGVSLRVIHTPGHASNHVCLLLEETGMMFTGDHIIQGSTVVIWPPDGNMRAYLDSLRRFSSLPISILAPGHGYLIGQPQAEAERLIRHRLAREEKVCKALVASGGSAALETLLRRVYDDVPAAIHPIAAHSLQAHLEKLLEDGEVSYSDGRYGLR